MKRLLLVFAVMTLIAPACGGGDSGSDSTSASEEPGDAPTSESPDEATEEEPEEVDMTACLKGPEAKTKITLRQVDFMFKPRTLKVPAGEMITLVVQNEGSVDHTFTSDALKCDSDLVSPDTKTTVTFKMPKKAVPFYCTPHESAMTGKLVPT
jgi:plastocyanin